MSYLDEIRGLNIGTANGLRRGYDEGWNDALSHVSAIERERDDLAWTANALAAIAAAALSAIEGAPEEVQIAALQHYNQRCQQLLGSVLRCEPHADPTVLQREPDVANWLPHIAARLHARQSYNADPSL
ncbi:hypothetical protein Q6A26_19055 [Xanthomonas euvesicatoria pv. eucalypti]|uniref:hypothetical protein n=1 Tax=Xanthomonas euvesicatoria TaxID=456327 RepID=UPI0026E44502|nr:hypothetical protein [Xanthomonas euvesicatoria]MDO7931072.1 hypothetical protein [Xanthomonas euvesicatoria pv. eucalypti]MDO7938326.1 hypothetical protein [Xanthomonas euvesicatoria pv. eucalypti]MDO7940511.1 hypothetical protein [Xanthomonas euvesicatoria pv. eucalypti]MDO7945133.1 hypothetical protein [Xanthomonas euvesicatoria pv. eucalypti]MDO7954907.1 hypothetical protein [Xanthomonas euvesicatoria pv. eucalypti]